MRAIVQTLSQRSAIFPVRYDMKRHIVGDIRRLTDV